MLVIISGPVRAVRAKGGDEVRDAAELKALHGWTYQEDGCANDVHDDSLADVELQGGDLRLTWDGRKKTVRVITTYRTSVKLKPKQLTALRDETIGQWTDGVGAGCFANESKKQGVKLEYCADPKQVTTKQEDDKPAGGGKPTRVTIFGAIKRGSIDGVRKALAAGEDLTVVREHMTPLMAAVSAGNVEIVRMLLDAKADVNATTRDRGSAIHMCTTIRADQLNDKTSAAIAQLLCERGAKLNVVDIYGHAPLEMTKHTKKKLTAEVLKKAGAKLHSPTITFRDPQGNPKTVRFMYGHASAQSWRDCKANKEGEAQLADLISGPHVVKSLTNGVRIEPKDFAVLESGEAQPATFTCLPE